MSDKMHFNYFLQYRKKNWQFVYIWKKASLRIFKCYCIVYINSIRRTKPCSGWSGARMWITEVSLWLLDVVSDLCPVTGGARLHLGSPANTKFTWIPLPQKTPQDQGPNGASISKKKVSLSMYESLKLRSPYLEKLTVTSPWWRVLLMQPSATCLTHDKESWLCLFVMLLTSSKCVSYISHHFRLQLSTLRILPSLEYSKLWGWTLFLLLFSCLVLPISICFYSKTLRLWMLALVH